MFVVVKRERGETDGLVEGEGGRERPYFQAVSVKKTKHQPPAATTETKRQ